MDSRSQLESGREGENIYIYIELFQSRGHTGLPSSPPGVMDFSAFVTERSDWLIMITKVICQLSQSNKISSRIYQIIPILGKSNKKWVK